MAIFLPNLSNLRRLEWARTYTWDIMIPEAPAPFSDWFPAVSVDETPVNIQSFQYAAPFMQFTVPQTSGLLDLRVTFIDQDDLALYHWMKKWVLEDILHFYHKNPYLGFLKDIVKPIHIVKYRYAGNKQEDIISYIVYYVYPENNLADALTSDSGLRQFPVFFRICGRDKLK